jgi:uncharacterized protein YdhG (YjbR/CyaY superfamily)
MQTKTTESGIDLYIALFPPDLRKKLETLRQAIRAAAPGAEERMSYRMPAFWLNGYLAYFAAFKSHIGFYPTASGIRAFQKELSGYVWSKGAVQFPLDQPLPLSLVRKIVKFRVSENCKSCQAKTVLKAQQRKKIQHRRVA